MFRKHFRPALLLLCAGVLLAACRPRYDVYLLIGQSNMAGRGFFEAADTLAPLEGVFLLDDRGEAVPAREPLNRYSTIRKALSVQGMGPGHGFAEEMHRLNGRPVLLVVNARGGSSLEQWLPDAPHGRFSDSPNEEEARRGQEMLSFYGEAVRRCRQAMRYGRLKAILWHQGESDSDSLRASTYLPALAIAAVTDNPPVIHRYTLRISTRATDCLLSSTTMFCSFTFSICSQFCVQRYEKKMT